MLHRHGFTLIAAAFIGQAGAARAGEPARVTVVAARDHGAGQQLQATGAIRARVQSDLAFRTNGKIVERAVDVGAHVVAGDLIARLDPRQQEADVAAAAALVASKRAVESPAAVEFERQRQLLASGNGTAVAYDNALKAMRQATADVVAAVAALASAKEQLSYTTLVSPAPGLVVARDAEVGEVVRAGGRIVTLAVDGPRDAVFAVSEATMARPLASPRITVALASDPTVRTVGVTRTISPLVDAATATIEVKIALDAPPPQMTVGVPVIGSALFTRAATSRLPWNALTSVAGKPAIWVLERDGRTATRAVEVLQYVTGSVDVTGHLEPGDHIVSEGTQFLRPGQSVVVVGVKD